MLDIEDLRRLQADLNGRIMDDEHLCERIDRNFGVLQSLAKTWQTVAADRHPQLPRFINLESGVPLMNLELLKLSAIPSARDNEAVLNVGETAGG